MNNDTQVRELLQRMAYEIDASPLDPSTPVRRARRRRSVTTVVVAVIVSAIVSGGVAGWRSFAEPGLRPANPSPPPSVRNSSIAVFGWMKGVRSLSADGTGEYIFKCDRTCNHVAAAFSPDGTRLAFSTSCGPACSTAGDPYNGIHVVDLVSGSDRLVVPGELGGALAWSPDGRHIAYVRGERGATAGSRIVVMSEDGSGRSVVASLPSVVGQITWSPDGSRIAFDAGDRVYVAALDGSAPSILVEGRSPTWSPDGGTIAYFGGSGGGWGCEVRLATPDGRNDASLIDLEAVSDRCDFGGDLEWSPDGSALAALVFQEVAPRKGWSAVYIVDPAESSARSFTGWVAGTPWGGLTWRPVQ